MPKGGGSVEGGQLNPRLRLMQDADMKGKVVLVRADHNVVKKGGIKDYYRIDVTFGTLYGIVEKGGRPIVMTHVGRPRDKNTAKIRFDEDTSVTPVVEYLQDVLSINIHIPKFSTDPDYGILHLEGSIYEAIDQLKTGKINMIYLPNTRWFRGEESKGDEREEFAKELASLADIYVYDAFGSWRPHVSTYDIARLLPSYAGLLVQKELQNLHRLFQPDRPFLAVVAGAKYDTKLGPLKVLHEKVDHLILGGILYNAYLSAKYDIEIQGVDREQKELARSLVELDQKN
ncbi:MAG TPA: phosphoglycerate kinase, partial [Desulfobacterales bacterium]|nr:phosphoglycerate kinase [Desulfobacterales bacterium]